VWLLFPVVAQVEPAWVRLLNKRNFSAAAPTFQFLLTGDRIVHVPEVLKPNQPIQMIALCETVHFSVSMLVQTAANVVCDPYVQTRATFIGENVHPVVVIAHTSKTIRDVSLRST